MTWDKRLEIAGFICVAPVLIGAGAREVVRAYSGDAGFLIWLSWALFVLAWVAQAVRKRRDKKVVATSLGGTVRSIDVDDRDGQDCYRVHDADGELIFRLWGAPGLYQVGDAVKLEQTVERV